nr:hypothetical protein [Escherichia coli]
MRSGSFIKDKITKEAETKQDTTEQQKTFKQQPNGWSSLSTTGKIISATGIAIGCAVLGIFGNPFDKKKLRLTNLLRLFFYRSSIVKQYSKGVRMDWYDVKMVFPRCLRLRFK